MGTVRQFSPEDHWFVWGDETKRLTSMLERLVNENDSVVPCRVNENDSVGATLKSSIKSKRTCLFVHKNASSSLFASHGFSKN